MLAAASWLGTRMHEAALVASCEGAGTTIMEGWRGGRRDAVRQAVLASGLPRAERTADQILAWMDAGFDAWRETRTEACLNAEVRGSWSARDVELSTWCLEEVQMDLDAMSAELLEADASVARRAVSMASDKPTAPACLEIEVLRRLPEPPEEHREEIRSVRAELSRVGALTAAGRFDAALAGARAAHDRAAALAWPSLLASAGGMHGRALIRLGDYAAAEPLLEEAYFVALRAGDHRMAAATADVLCFLVGNHLSRHADGLRWSRHAEASHAALGGSGGDLTRVAHLENRGAVYFDMGKFAEAREAYERSLEIDERILGPDHPEVAVTLNNLANTYTVVGEYDEARRLLGRALAIREAALDPDHPDLALTLTNLGSAESAAGLDAEALAHYERSLAIWEASVGREHPEVGATLNNLGTVYAALGRTEEARAAWIRARGIWERAVGPDHPEVSYSLDNLAGLHAAAGEHAEARRLFERSLTIQEAALGPSHPDLVPALVGLAGVALAEGATAEARRLADRATALAGPGEHAAEVADDLRELQEALAVPVPPSSRP
jgi:tetratricopeptide (TPR) repeat protein